MTYRNALLLAVSACSLSGCIAAAAIPIVAGGGAIFRDGVSDDARGGGEAATGEVTVSQAPPTPAMVAQPAPAPTPTPTPAPALASAELAEPGFDTLPAPAPAPDPIPAAAPALAQLTTPALEPALAPTPVSAPVSAPTPALAAARPALVEADPAPVRRGPEPVIVLTLPPSGAARAPAPEPAPAPVSAPPPAIALAPEPAPAPTPEPAPIPTPEPEPAVDFAAEFADLAAPEPEPVPAPAPEPEPAPPALAAVELPPSRVSPPPEPAPPVLAAVELPPARVSPLPAPVATPTPAPTPAPSPAPVQPLAQPPAVEPPVVAPVEEPQGQALVGYAALRSYVLRTLGGGLPLPSAVLADPTTLQPVRSNCSGNAPTIVIDLDPAGGLVPLSGPLNLNNALARVLTELRARDVNVAWVTDRSPLDARAVRDRLVASGLDPESRDSLYVERYPGETKQSRRAAIGQTSCIIAMAGDERADFDDLYNFLIDYSAARALEPMLGTGWFLIDNPVGQ